MSVLAITLLAEPFAAETSAKPAPSTTPLKMEEVSGSQAPVDQSPCLPTAGTKRKIVPDCDSTESDGNTDNGECKKENVMHVCTFLDGS